ncbi:MAG: helix-turn-helix transcriptional regulator [Ruminococcaceae bacterium]|nr:helix-turn-helix transcriptional regulator [Oscillospiraceae bacterium]
MFINKTKDGKNNLCGERIAQFRKELKLSQKKLSDRLQLAGLDVDKNAIQRMESGQRFITDIELVYLSKVLDKSIEELFGITQ